jgi:hypothetical protein
VPQPAVILFYPRRMRFAGQPAVIGKGRQEAVPIVRRYRIPGNSQPYQPLPQLFRGFQVPFSSYIPHNFSRLPMISVNETDFVLLFPYIRPKLVYFQAVIVFFFQLYHINSRSKCSEHLRDAYFEDGADVPNADSPYQHDFYQIGYTGEASPVGFFMIRDKLAPAVFTEIIPGAACFFSRFGL